MPAITATSDLIKSAPAHRVYVKRFWGDSWTLIDFLYCLQAAKGMNPEGGWCALEWRYGVGRQPNAGGYAVFSPLELLNWYVRVEIDRDADDLASDPEFLTWTGILWEVIDSRDGARLYFGNRVLSGKQAILGYGLEVLLERKTLRESIVTEHLAGTWSEFLVKRAIPFNEETGRAYPDLNYDIHRNRSLGRGNAGCYLFTDDRVAPQQWSTHNILEYLVACHMPVNADGDAILRWQLAHPHCVPDYDAPRKNFHGRTLRSIVDELLPRQRALGWWVELEDQSRDATNPTLVIHTATFTDQYVVGTYGLLPANPNVITIDPDLALNVSQSPLKESAAQTVEQVVVLGDRIKTCVTLSWIDQTLARGWSAQQEQEYEAGANPSPSLDVSEQARLNAQARGRDALKPVFSYFVLPEPWNGLVRNGVGGAQQSFLPDEIDADEFDGPEENYRPGLRFLDYLPFKDKAHTEVATEYAKPLCLLKIEDLGGGDLDRYSHIGFLASTSDLDGEVDDGGWNWAGHVQVLDNEAGLAVTITGAPQHIFASSDFAPRESDRPTELDYLDNLIVTVFLAADRHVAAHWPLQPYLPAADVVRRVEIDLGDKAQLWYLPAGTVLGVDENCNLIHQPVSMWLKDDRPRMEDLARLAYEWYARERRALAITFKLLTDVMRVGMYIQTVGAGASLKTVNSVITQVIWDVENGRTEVQSSFAELDFASFY